MRLRTSFAVLACGLLTATACDDSVTPGGAPSTLQVAVYVDVDGSSTLSAGDQPITGVNVVLTENSGAATQFTAATGSDGVATFADVPVGSYTASLAAGPGIPPGTDLASAPVLTVRAPFEGAALDGEFRFVYQAGSLSGVVFRDDNGNGAADAGDTPGAGFLVRLYHGVAAAGTPRAEVTADADGAYTFPLLPPGDYTLEVVPPLPTVSVAGGSTRTVTLAGGQNRAERFLFTGTLLMPIATARVAAEGETVVVEGVVTVPQGAFSSRSVYIQDASGGVQVFGVESDAGFLVGDSLRVVGVAGAFNDQFQITSPIVTRLGTGRTLQPRTVTGTEFFSRAFEGDLARFTNARVLSVGNASSSGAFNITVQAESGDTATVRVSNRGIGIAPDAFVVGRRYNIAGVLGSFRGTPQLLPRMAGDVESTVQSGTSDTPVSEARLAALGDTVLVAGVVTAGNDAFGRSFYFQDLTGGLQVFRGSNTSIDVRAGDSIRVRGVLGQFNDELQITGPAVTVLKQVAAPQPREITGTEFLSGTFEGQLVALRTLTVTSVGNASSSGAFNVTATSLSGDTVTVRINGSDVGVTPAAFTAGMQYSVTGVLGSFRGTPQLKPRSTADVQGATGETDIARANSDSLGSSVTIAGVVTAGQGTFNSRSIYVQDRTGGIQVFGLESGAGFAVGDRVRVQGEVGEFNQQRQVINPVATRLGTGTIPQPRVVTAAEVNARTFEGSLAALRSARVVSVGSASSSGAYNVTVEGPAGEQVVIRINGSAIGIEPSFWTVGSVYNITGLLGSFRGAAQIFPRSATDVSLAT